MDSSVYPRSRIGKPRGSQSSRAKINEWQAVGIMARWLQGFGETHIAYEFGVSKGTAGNIVRGKAWTHLFEEEV